MVPIDSLREQSLRPESMNKRTNFIINLIDLDATNFADFGCESRPRDFISPHFYCHGESNGSLLMNFLLNFYNCGLNDREVEWQQQRLWSGTMELNSLLNGRFWGNFFAAPRRDNRWPLAKRFPFARMRLPSGASGKLCRKMICLEFRI